MSSLIRESYASRRQDEVVKHEAAVTCVVRLDQDWNKLFMTSIFLVPWTILFLCAP